MLFSTAILLLLASSLSILTSARPTKFVKRDYYAIWTISDYTRGCSPGGCIYTFNVTAPAVGNVTSSAFTTSCTGPISEDFENYQDSIACANESVKWKLDILSTVDEIYISHAWNGTGDGYTPCIHNMTGTQALAKQQTGTFEMVQVYSYSTC